MFALIAVHLFQLVLGHCLYSRNTDNAFRKLKDNKEKDAYKKAAMEYRPETKFSIGVNLFVTLSTGLSILIYRFTTHTCQHFYQSWVLCDAIVLIASVPLNYMHRWLEKE